MFSTKRISYHLVTFSRQLSIHLSTTWLSLLVLLVLAGLLMFLEQGGTVMIDLFHCSGNNMTIWKVINLLLLYIYVGSFSLILSHYPIYLFMNRRNNWTKKRARTYQWVMQKPNFFELFGLITFEKRKDKDGNVLVKDRTHSISLEETYKFRHSLGIVFFSMLIYVLTFTSDRFAGGLVLGEPIWWTVFHWVVSSIVYVLLNRQKRKWMYLFLFRIRLIAVYTSIIVGTSLIVSSVTVGWSLVTYGLIFGLIFLRTLCFIVFRLTRGVDLKSIDSNEENESRKKRREELKNKIERIRKRLPLGRFDKNSSFLKLLSIVGYLSVLVIIASHLDPMVFNPLIVVFAYLNIFYGIIIISLKHYIYYSSNSILLVKKFGAWTKVLPLLARIGVVLPFALIFMDSCDNNLHQLPKITESVQDDDIVTFNEFKSSFKERNKDNSKVYFISSYGGGLKANYWNLKVLSKLKEEGILDQTFSMSGVSGGGLGQSFFSMIGDKENRDNIISDLGQSNFVTLDLTYLLGFDFIRSKMPWKTSFDDRARKSMKLYGGILGGDDGCAKEHDPTSKPFRNFWKQEYDNSGEVLPMLIGNTSGTNGKRGIVCSVKMNKDTFDHTFPYCEDLLSLGDGKTLSYFDGVSLANRFPLMSPAGRIENYGHYVDGGYYENSGLLTNINLYKFIEAEDPEYFEGKKVVFIQILNGSNDNTWLETREVDIACKRGKREGEISMIIGTGTSLEMLPRLIATQFENEIEKDTSVELTYINLPYKIDDGTICATYNLESFCNDNLYDITKRNNDSIQNVLIKHAQKHYGFGLEDTTKLKWKYIQPPLARALGQQVKTYMDIMSEQDFVYKDLIIKK